MINKTNPNCRSIVAKCIVHSLVCVYAKTSIKCQRKFNGGVTAKIVICTSMSTELSNSLISDWDNLTWTLG